MAPDAGTAPAPPPPAGMRRALHVLDHAGLGGSRVARVVFGGVFDLKDLACYAIGVGLAVLVDRRRRGDPSAAG